MRRSMRDAGCRCDPRIVANLDPADGPPGVRVGWLLEHAKDCPLGQRVYAANRLGFLPSMVSVPPPRCAR